MSAFELTPEFDGRKSFYGKARVAYPAGTDEVELFSYESHVMTLNPLSRVVSLHPRWDESATTLRHVKELLKQNGFTAVSKSQIARDYA